MKIVIGNIKFDFNIGCRLLKAKYKQCPNEKLEDFWNEIVPITFNEIVKEFTNVEERRIAVGCLGIEQIEKQVSPKLISEKTIPKKTTWVNQQGELEQVSFNDTYKLFKVSKDNLGSGIEGRGWGISDAYFLKFKDTSTDREYMLWVDLADVIRNSAHYLQMGNGSIQNEDAVDAIDCIAWTIQTNVEMGGIEKIVRQGDCILIKKKDDARTMGVPRHLSKDEYLTLLDLES